MKRWPKQRRFLTEDGLRERRPYSKAWQRRAERYLRSAGMDYSALIFRRVDLPEERWLVDDGRVSRRSPRRHRGLWANRLAPRGRARGRWAPLKN